MKLRAGIVWVGAIVALVFAQPAGAQANGSAAARTIWDGVYTLEQAERGQSTAAENCAACHSPADWGSSAFLTRWSGGSIAHLHVKIREEMPYDGPGRLSPAEYADIVAYMLRLNEAPPGEEELPANDAALDKIQVTAAPHAH